VQPHFSDLVVGTYGRGFWILDDVTPLRQLNDEALKSDVHLFTPRSAYRFRHVRETSSDPNSAVRGQNPHYGADVDYYLSAATDTAGARDSTGKASTKVRLAILNARGDTIRTLDGTRRHGLNRVYWDLRYAPVRPPRLRTPPPGKPWVTLPDSGWRPLVVWDLDLSQQGPLAPPGTYTVRLTEGATTLSQPLTVLKDPNTMGTVQDIQQQVNLALAIRSEMDSVVGLINRIEWLRKQIEDLGVQLADSSTVKNDSVAQTLAKAGHDLEEKLIGVEGDLFDVHLTGAREDAFRNPTKLYGRLSALLSDVAEDGADFPPTSQQQQVNAVLQQRLGAAAGAFANVLQHDVGAFRGQLRAARLPDVLAGNP